MFAFEATLACATAQLRKGEQEEEEATLDCNNSLAAVVEALCTEKYAPTSLSLHPLACYRSREPSCSTSKLTHTNEARGLSFIRLEPLDSA